MYSKSLKNPIRNQVASERSVHLVHEHTQTTQSSERDSSRISSIDDFVHIVGMQNTQVIAPIEHEYIEENLEETKHSNATEAPSHTYITNSPSMDDDFLGGVSASTPILENEGYVHPPEESPPSSDEDLFSNQKQANLNSLFFPFKKEKRN